MDALVEIGPWHTRPVAENDVGFIVEHPADGFVRRHLALVGEDVPMVDDVAVHLGDAAGIFHGPTTR